MKIANNVTELVGNTPLVRLQRLTEGCVAEVVAKLEFYNPAHSVKDRIGVSMIEAAEQAGLIKPDTIILEPTSGNTGIALAFVCAARGYKCVLIMPETMSKERRALLRAYGAELVLTPAVRACLAPSRKLRRWLPPIRAILSRNNSRIQPILIFTAAQPQRRSGRIPMDRWISWSLVLVRGGLSPALARYLRSASHRFVASRLSLMLRQCYPVAPKVRTRSRGSGRVLCRMYSICRLVDEIIRVKGEDAFTIARRMAREEGLLVGISSGAATWAALQVAQRSENTGKLIIVIIPSFGERYLSTALFAELLD